MATAEGRAPARTALAGNPSDGYGGATLALALPALTATVVLHTAGRPAAAPPIPLVAATIARFSRETGIAPVAVARAEVASEIPVSVGLGGSSAIVIATLRALCGLCDVPLAPDRMAELALAVETEDLGIAAGLQDRVAQAYGGLTFMEFAPARGGPRYEPLDPRLLPPLVIGWRGDHAAPSGVTHGGLRDRYAAGEPAVRAALATAADHARAARDALLARDLDALRAAIDGTYDARAEILDLAPAHVAMVETARAAGAAANYTGSGGAVVAACADPAQRTRVTAALAALGCGTLVAV